MSTTLKPIGSTNMTPAERLRLWNARRGVARAAEQIATNFAEAYDVLAPLHTEFQPVFANLEAALEELRAAEAALKE